MKVIRITLFYFLLINFASAQSLEEAKNLTRNEQYEPASVIYKKIISKEPTLAEPYYFFSENVLLNESNDSARIIIKNGLRKIPDNPLLKIGYAKILLNGPSLEAVETMSQEHPGNELLKKSCIERRSNVDSAMLLINEAINTTDQRDTIVLMEAAASLIHFNNKDLKKAKQFLDSAIVLEPSNIRLQILYGDLNAELRNLKTAVEYYNKATEADKNSPVANVQKGRLFMLFTDYKDACAEFNKAIDLTPGYIPAYRELGQSNFKSGNRTAATENFNKYIELSGNSCNSHIRYALFLRKNNDFTGALNELIRLQDKCDTNNLTMLRILAECYYQMKDSTGIRKGLETINRLFNKLPAEKRSPSDYECYGKLLVANRQYTEGIQQFRIAYSIMPENTTLISEIATAQFILKQYADVITTIKEKIEIGKDVTGKDYLNLGQSYYFLSKYILAESAFAKANEILPVFPRGWYWRAMANSKIDSTAEAGLAIPFFNKYIELAESDSTNMMRYQVDLTTTYNYLIQYYKIKKDPANELAILRKKLKLPMQPEEKKSIQSAIDDLEGSNSGK